MKCFGIIQYVITIIIVLLHVDLSLAYRILGLFPHPALSHYRVFQPILKGLAAAGHNLTIFSHFPWKDAPENYKDVRLSGDLLTEGIDFRSDWFKQRRTYGHYTEFQMTHAWATEACHRTYNMTEIQNLIHSNEKYDIILMEHFITDCMMGIAWKLQAPVIGMSSCPLLPWLYDRVGTPFNPSYMPSFFTDAADKMTFPQRARNLVNHYLSKIIQKTFLNPISDKILREQFGPDVPSVEELIKNTSLLFVNTHYSISGSKPTSPALIEIGGIHLRKTVPMDASLKDFLDNATEGVIYVSWGSMVKADSMSTEMRDSLANAFGSFKQKVLWKWESDIPNKPKNVFIHKWLPQQEILCHPNVKVFLTHGGLLGTIETAHCGTPVVSTPMYGDQFHNSALLADRGMGVVVHYEDITTESIREAIAYALDVDTQENARRISFEFRNRMNTPIETAIWWVEHVAQTGGAKLTKSHSVHLSWYAYHCIDIYAAFIGLLVLSVSFWIWVIRKCCCRNGEKVKVKTN